MSIQELEIIMWNAAKSRDSKAFLEVVDEKAVMVCGGFRCSGADYISIWSRQTCHQSCLFGLKSVLMH